MGKHFSSSYLSKIGIFSIFALITAISIYIYSPVIISNASDSNTVKVNVEVNPVASISLDPEELVFDIAPTIDGAFDSKSISIISNTNSSDGYELYFSSEDDETDMVHEDDNVDDKITSNFSDTVTRSSMPANSWGYSLDNQDYNAIPTATNQLTLVNIDHYPEAGEDGATIYIGTKISSALRAGAYSKNLVFSVLAHDAPGPVLTMQTFDSSMIASGESVELEDSRDNKEYNVKKLADNRVWMTKDLEIASDRTISSTDSDLPDGAEYTISSSGVTVDTEKGVTLYSYGAATAGTSTEVGGSICPKGWRLPTGYVGRGEFDDLNAEYGTVSELLNATDIRLTGYTYKNWYGDPVNVESGVRYWTGGKKTNSGNVIQITNDGVGGATANTSRGDLAQIRCVKRETYNINLDANGGVVSPSSISVEKGYDLELPTPTSSDPDSKFVGWYTAKNGGEMVTRFDSALTASGNTLYAHWEQPSATPMQSFSCSSLSNIGDSVVLKDSRDGSNYIVKKLADGKCWMIDNLKIIDKTITSDDSNLPNGTSFTIPASDITAFTTAYDTSAAYLDNDEDGGYYNFYTATAGWGVQSIDSGTSPRDICPKGWRLPARLSSDYNKNELSDTLLGSYTSQTQFRRDFVPFGHVGYISGGSLYNYGVYTDIITAKVGTQYTQSILSIGDYIAISGSHYYKYIGYSIRCLTD